MADKTEPDTVVVAPALVVAPPDPTQDRIDKGVTASAASTKAAVISDAEILRSAGQRKINQVWEYTQSFIAIIVTISTLYVAAILATNGSGDTAAFLLLSNAFFLVIGFYFGRTNHQKTGGVGGDLAGTR